MILFSVCAMADKEAVDEDVAAEAEPGNEEESQTLVMIDEMDYCPGTPVQDEPTYEEVLLGDNAEIAAPVTGPDKNPAFHVASNFAISSLCTGVRPPGTDEAPDEALDYEDDLEEQTAVSVFIFSNFSFFVFKHHLFSLRKFPYTLVLQNS